LHVNKNFIYVKYKCITPVGVSLITYNTFLKNEAIFWNNSHY